MAKKPAKQRENRRLFKDINFAVDHMSIHKDIFQMISDYGGNCYKIKDKDKPDDCIFVLSATVLRNRFPNAVRKEYVVDCVEANRLLDQKHYSIPVTEGEVLGKRVRKPSVASPSPATKAKPTKKTPPARKRTAKQSPSNSADEFEFVDEQNDTENATGSNHDQPTSPPKSAKLTKNTSPSRKRTATQSPSNSADEFEFVDEVEALPAKKAKPTKTTLSPSRKRSALQKSPSKSVDEFEFVDEQNDIENATGNNHDQPTSPPKSAKLTKKTSSPSRKRITKQSSSKSADEFEFVDEQNHVEALPTTKAKPAKTTSSPLRKRSAKQSPSKSADEFEFVDEQNEAENASQAVESDNNDQKDPDYVEAPSTPSVSVQVAKVNTKRRRQSSVEDSESERDKEVEGEQEENAQKANEDKQRERELLSQQKAKLEKEKRERNKRDSMLTNEVRSLVPDLSQLSRPNSPAPKVTVVIKKAKKQIGEQLEKYVQPSPMASPSRSPRHTQQTTTTSPLFQPSVGSSNHSQRRSRSHSPRRTRLPQLTLDSDLEDIQREKIPTTQRIRIQKSQEVQEATQEPITEPEEVPEEEEENEMDNFEDFQKNEIRIPFIDHYDYNEWNDSLSVPEKKSKGIMWGMLSSFVVESQRKNNLLTQDDILLALYLSSGIFEGAQILLDVQFDFTRCPLHIRRRIFTEKDDEMLRNGEYPKFKAIDAIHERIEFLGIEIDPSSNLSQALEKHKFRN